MKKRHFIYLLTLLFVLACATQKSNTDEITDINQQPNGGPIPEINLGKAKTFKLDNGLEVLVVENNKLPRVSATLAIDNGPIYEGRKAGTSSLLSGMMGSGTDTISKDDFHDQIDYLGASLSFGSQSASMSSLSKYFSTMMALMAEGVKHPLLTQEDFDSERAKLIDLIKSNENDVEAVSSQVQSALVYGKHHPYGELITLKTLNTVNLEDVKAFYDTYYIPNNAYLIVIGDVKFKDVKEHVKQYFSDWKTGEEINYLIPGVTNVGQTEIDFVDMPNAVQSNIAVTNAVELKKDDPDFFAALLANKILGAGADARLFDNLREKHGYTYGAYSSLGNDNRTASRFSAFAKVRNEVTDSSVVEFVKEIKLIRDKPVTEEELKIAKAAYTGSFVRSLEQPSTVARFSLNIKTENLPEDYYKTYLEKLNAVTIEEVQEAAQKYFKADQLRIIIVGNASDVVPNLEKLGYKINYFDKEGNPLVNGTSKDFGYTANDIYKKYIKAIGGFEDVKAIRTLKTQYSGESEMGPIDLIDFRTPYQFSEKTLINRANAATVFSTDEGLFMKQGHITHPLPKTFFEDLYPTIGVFMEVALLDNPNCSFEGIEEVDGKKAYKVAYTTASLKIISYYDRNSALKIKETSIMKLGDEEPQVSNTYYANYDSYEGVLFPGLKTAEFGPKETELILKYILVNEPITDENFE